MGAARQPPPTLCRPDLPDQARLAANVSQRTPQRGLLTQPPLAAALIGRGHGAAVTTGVASHPAMWRLGALLAVAAIVLVAGCFGGEEDSDDTGAPRARDGAPATTNPAEATTNAR